MNKKEIPANPSGLSVEENLLLTAPLAHGLGPEATEELWDRYQAIIARLLIRMGSENKMLDSIVRVPLIGSLEAVYTRIALVPKIGKSALNALGRHTFVDSVYRLAGELTLMELSAAAGYRTFCFPALVAGLMKTGKMKNRPVDRMMDTFDFLNCMFQLPLRDPLVSGQLERTIGLHRKYRVAGAANKAAQDLFKYIALNMFYIGPSMRPDITPQERYAICGITVLVCEMMGQTIESSVNDLDAFIAEYEATQMFDRDDHGRLRREAVEIAQASKAALYKIPTISAARVHGYVPYRVKKILEID
jgi:hypothetical protein